MLWLVYGLTMQIVRKPSEPENVRHSAPGWLGGEQGLGAGDGAFGDRPLAGAGERGGE